MAIDKSLYAAPVGLEAMAMEGAPPALEIEIEDPEAVRIGMDGMEIELTPGAGAEGDGGFDDNLAEVMEERELEALASE